MIGKVKKISGYDGKRMEIMGRKWGNNGGVMEDAQGDTRSILGLLFSRRGGEQR